MVVAELHRGIDIARTRYTLLEHTHRFQPERDSQPARCKSRNVFNDDRFFAHLAANVDNCLYGTVACLLPDDDLYQPHDVDRIEEVHANNGFRASRKCGYFRNRQRRSIACKDKWVVRNALELPKYVLFQLQLLRRGLEDQIRGGTIL